MNTIISAAPPLKTAPGHPSPLNFSEHAGSSSLAAQFAQRIAQMLPAAAEDDAGAVELTDVVNDPSTSTPLPLPLPSRSPLPSPLPLPLPSPLPSTAAGTGTKSGSANGVDPSDDGIRANKKDVHDIDDTNNTNNKKVPKDVNNVNDVNDIDDDKPFSIQAVIVAIHAAVPESAASAVAPVPVPAPTARFHPATPAFPIPAAVAGAAASNDVVANANQLGRPVSNFRQRMDAAMPGMTETSGAKNGNTGSTASAESVENAPAPKKQTVSDNATRSSEVPTLPGERVSPTPQRTAAAVQQVDTPMATAATDMPALVNEFSNRVTQFEQAGNAWIGTAHIAFRSQVWNGASVHIAGTAQALDIVVTPPALTQAAAANSVDSQAPAAFARQEKYLSDALTRRLGRTVNLHISDASLESISSDVETQ